jgi:hypothetical protein
VSATTIDRVGSLSPRDAAAEALARLLMERLEARVFGGKAPDRAFRLEAVYPDWPDGETRLVTPSASIADVQLGVDDWDVVDVDVGDDDIAARAQEMSGEFAVDLWATDREERRALKAAFLGVFRSGRSRGGVAVIVPMPDKALAPTLRGRAVFQVRLAVEEPPRDVGDREGAVQDAWRAQGRVAWEAEMVTIEDAGRIVGVMRDLGVREGAVRSRD